MQLLIHAGTRKNSWDLVGLWKQNRLIKRKQIQIQSLNNLLKASFSTFQSAVCLLALRWRHNGGDSVSNHQPHHCLLNRLFRHRSNKTSKLRATGLCAGNSPVTGEFPAQMTSYAENVSIWWRHHGWPSIFRTSTCTVIGIWGPAIWLTFELNKALLYTCRISDDAQCSDQTVPSFKMNS